MWANSHIGRMALGAAIVMLPAIAVRAQIDTPAGIPPTSTKTSDADHFFERYRQAASFLRQNKLEEARATMDLLSKGLSTAPWLEIALLKYSELCEQRYGKEALENYGLLRKRLENAPYYQGDTEYARLFRTALEGAVEQGIRRVRLLRIRDALERYYVRHSQYPESLAKLAILNYIDIEDITDANQRSFRYVPMGQRLTPAISYHRYELETVPGEPFSVSSPRIDETSRISDDPEKYAVLIWVPGRPDAMRVTEGRTLHGYFIAAVAREGAIVCTANRVLVLMTRGN